MNVIGIGAAEQNSVTRDALNASVAGGARKKFAQRSTVLRKEGADGEARFHHSASGPLRTLGGMHSLNIYQEIFMKSMARAILVGGFIVAAQAAVADGSAFPPATHDTGPNIPFQSSYADRHAGEPVRSAGSAFPPATHDTGPNIPFQSSYADSHLGRPAFASQSAQGADTGAN